MALKRTFDTPAKFQQAVEVLNLDLSAVPVRLAVASALELVDDFNDGIRDPKWLTSSTYTELLTFDYVSGFFNNMPLRTVASREKVAQTFKLSQSKTVGRVSLKLSREGIWAAGQYKLWVELRPTTGAPGEEIPTDTVLASAYMDPRDVASTWPDTANWYEFYMGPVELQAGVTYAIVVWADYPIDPSNFIGVHGESSDQYADGRALLYPRAGGQWEATGSYAWQSVLYDHYFRLWEAFPKPEPTESGGTLNFDYPDPSGSGKLVRASCAQSLGDLEAEIRWTWHILNADANSSPLDNDWGFHLLQGPIAGSMTKVTKDSLCLWEIIHSTTPANGSLRIIPIMVDASGLKKSYNPGPQVWENYSPYTFYGFPVTGGSADGVPITLRVTRGPGGGLIFFAFANDDEGQVIFQTTESPTPRTLTGDVFLHLANSHLMWGSRFAFDYVKLSGALQEQPGGYLVLRHTLAEPSKIKSLAFQRTLPPGTSITVRLRAADSVDAIAGLPFWEPIQTTVDGDQESAAVEMAEAKYIDTKLEFEAASPSPELGSITFEQALAAVDDDKPIILSLDEVGPGPVQIQTSEGETDTPNTKKLEDGDPATQYESTDSTDGNEVAITILFENPEGGGAWKDINAIILRNTNLKLARIELGPAVIFDGELTSEDEIVAFPTTNFNGITIVGISTKTPNEKKKIGEVYVGRVQLALPEFDEYEPRRVLRLGGSYESIGGNLISYKGVHKYASRWVISRVATPDKNALESVFAEQRQVTFWPEPKAQPRRLYDVAWTVEELPSPYSEAVKTDGHTVEADMTELEGRS